jgi:hemin uptake protein HemP
MTETRSERDGGPVDKELRLPVVSSRTLLAGHREVIIEHGTERYRLRLTASNKLILVK